MIPFIACNTTEKSKPVLQWSKYAALPGTGNMPSLGYAGPVTGISNNTLIVAGGANFPGSMPWEGGKKQYYDEAYITGIDVNPPSFKKVTLPYKVAYSANCSTPLGIVCAGGENESGPLSRVLFIQFDKGFPVFVSLPDLPVAVTNAAATAIGSDVYIAGGETKTAASVLFFKIDLKDTAKGWQKLPDIPHAVSHTVLLAAGNEKIFLAGGRRKTESGISELYNNVFEYNITSGKWAEKQSLPYALSAGTGAMINDHYIALFGGDKGTVFHKTEQLISAISHEQDSVKKQVLNEDKKQLQMSHPGFSKEVLLYDIQNDSWTTGGNIPFNVPVTTTAVKKGNRIWIPSGEIKAGVRTPQILEVNVSIKQEGLL